MKDRRKFLAGLFATIAVGATTAVYFNGAEFLQGDAPDDMTPEIEEDVRIAADKPPVIDLKDYQDIGPGGSTGKQGRLPSFVQAEKSGRLKPLAVEPGSQPGIPHAPAQIAQAPATAPATPIENPPLPVRRPAELGVNAPARSDAGSRMLATLSASNFPSASCSGSWSRPTTWSRTNIISLIGAV